MGRLFCCPSFDGAADGLRQRVSRRLPREQGGDGVAEVVPFGFGSVLAQRDIQVVDPAAVMHPAQGCLLYTSDAADE